MPRGRARSVRCIAAALLLLGPASAIAQGPAAAPPVAPGAAQDGWRFSLTPYAWLAGVSGEASLPRRSRDFDAEFGDILSALQFGAMGIFEARRGRFGMVVDALTLTIEQDISTPRSALFRGGDTRLTATQVSLVGLVRVVETPSWNLDLGAGARAWWFDGTVSLNAGLEPARSASGSTNFADPLLAIRYNVELAERIGFTAYADIGGFGTGSKLTWQVLAAFHWQATESIAAHLGYRHIAIEMERGAVALDMALSGPIIGASFRF